MHLIERYGLACGAKISKPEIQTSFFPLPCDKWVVLNVAGAMDSKRYLYWTEVLCIIIPELEKRNIKVIQLGDEKEPNLGLVYLAGQTNKQQSAYLVKNALALIGTDSFLTHLAAAFDTPIVSLYSISPPEVCGPYWGDKTKQKLLEPNFAPNTTYSYNPNDTASIQTIKIEKIVESIGEILDIKFPEITTKHLGQNYPKFVCEIIPNCVLSSESFPNSIPTIRFDLGGDENLVYENIYRRKCAIFSKKPLNCDILQKCKGNIERLIYKVDQNPDIDFLKKLQSSGIPFVLLTDEKDETMGEAKLNCCDYGVIHQEPKGKRPENLIIGENTWCKSSKVIISNYKTYATMENYLRGSAIENNDGTFKMYQDYQDFSDESFLFVFESVLTNH